MPLTFKKQKVGAVCVIACHGAIIFGEESAALREQVKQALPDSRYILLDFSSVSYVDSGGLGAIVGLFTSARSAGGDLKIAAMNQRVRHVFHITKLQHVIESFETVEKALRSWPHAA